MKLSIPLFFSLLLAIFQTAAIAQNPFPNFPAPTPPKAIGVSTRNLEWAGWETLRGDTNRIVLDVRSPQEFASGHIPRAINIDIRAAEFIENVKKLSKDKTYLVYCAIGGRSAKACTQMDGLKFKDTVNLLGGIRAWQAGGNNPVGGK